MNEQIKSLMVQAGMQFRLSKEPVEITGDTYTFEENYVYDKFDPVKFAELIREDERRACLEITDYCAEAHMPSSMAANAIHARRNQPIPKLQPRKFPEDEE